MYKKLIILSSIYNSNKQMIIPMRCFTCGTPLSNIRDKYLQLVLQYMNLHL